MMKMSYVLMLLLGAALVFTGCKNIKKVADVFQGSVMVDNAGPATTVNNTFKNISKEPIMVVGRARYAEISLGKSLRYIPYSR
ncbi:hypothetical protein [Paenibacillus roseipurpureus]|uniref:Uncharacterized protein n=1 Tax=Paenibacillus roseopurpureus TaxID=2918901 RepID=A0AA96LQ82_9BACL|nr:hypothetical protein [Paenibacillus sp. MBLB1832]WNR45286.1 hypothetical protein MJB10_03880 [Paenibacillus sp. MBLB1832]